MNPYIIVENEVSFRWFLGKKPESNKALWCTTSPLLLEKLPLEGFHVASLESNVGAEELWRLNDAASNIAYKIGNALDKDKSSPYGIKIGKIIAGKYRRSVFPILYKLHLLSRWLRLIDLCGAEGVIIGDPEIHSRGLGVDRFDTLYAILADCLVLPSNVSCGFHKTDHGERQKQKIQLLGGSLAERMLLLMNSNVALLAYKFWKIVLKGRTVALRSKNTEANILMHLECELLEEAFLYFLACGCRIIDFKRIAKDSFSIDEKSEWIADRNQLNSIWIPCLAQLQKDGLIMGQDLSGIISLVHTMLEDDVRTCIEAVPHYIRLAQRIGPKFNEGNFQPAALVGNALASPTQKTMFQIFNKAGIPVFALEHGITNGILQAAEYWHEENAMTNSHAWVCFNEISNNYHKRSKPDGAGKAVGMPRAHRKVRFGNLQRIFIRRSLKLPSKARIVIYVASLYHNNQIYAPFCFTDNEYHFFKKSVVFDVLGKVADPCLVKLYPTYRYPDEDPFAGLLKLPGNVRAIQFVEYRYLRAVADVVICDSPQSTLGWVWSSGKPLIYLDHPFSPVVPSVADRMDESIFRIDCSSDKWQEEALALLRLPHEELCSRWKKKEKERKEMEKTHIFGPRGRAGRNAAEFVVNETLRHASGKS